MSRNLIFLLVFCFAFSANSESVNKDKSLPTILKIIYPHDVRKVTIIFSSKDSHMVINYLTSEKKQKEVSKILSSDDSKIIIKDWENLNLPLSQSQSELNCDLSLMWVIEFEQKGKKVFCRNDKIIKALANIHQKIQMLLF